MHLPDLVNHACIKENALREGGLARIDAPQFQCCASARAGRLDRENLEMLERALASLQTWQRQVAFTTKRSVTGAYGALSSRMPLNAMET